jgi:hypothetical protein
MLLIISACAVLPAAAEPVRTFEKDVRPILKTYCFQCHGESGTKKGDLDVRLARFIAKGGESGPAIVAGVSHKSLMLDLIRKGEMPKGEKKLTPEQVVLIEQWIAQGAKTLRSEPERITDDYVDEEERSWWSFQPVRRPVVPVNAQGRSAPNVIDAFIDQALAKEGLTPAPAAAPEVLLRRVYVDLIGMPPTRQELRTFLQDQSSGAYERAVDRLLLDPRHGERWARHWMDVWRYSDWYGRRTANDVWNSAPQIWRWRDWIVKSLNRDKGYDRMLSEMLAGDEIAPLDDEAGVATGFLIRNWYALNPNQWMRDTIEHTGKAFLGLTFQCAHCHDHKYDPVSQMDYFRFRAIFEPIYVRQDRWPGEADPGAFQDYRYTTLRKPQRLGSVRIFDKELDAKTWFYTGGDERNRVADKPPIAPGVPAFLSERGLAIKPSALPAASVYPGGRPELQETEMSSRLAALTRAQEEILALMESTACTPAAKARARANLTAAQLDLASSMARIAADQAKLSGGAEEQQLNLARKAAATEREAAVATAEAALANAKYEKSLADALPTEADAKKREVAIATAMKAIATCEKTCATARQALNNPKLPDTAYTAFSPTYPAQTTGRRKALAEWLTRREQPLTARVAVNHLWMRHFQEPLVKTVFDFGRSGAQPTHPELLDWLAAELMEHGWSMRHLHRLIVTSQAYRRSSSANSANAQRDPDNRFLWRMNPSRMEAEVVRDSVLHLAGVLDAKMGGQEIENVESESSRRRSLYFSCHPENGGRSEMAAMFDAPEPNDCYRRTRSVLPQQALVLTNSKLIHDHSAALAVCAGAEAQDADSFITAAFEHILSRPPRAAELAACREFITTGGRAGLVRVLLNHNDFVTVR